MGIANGEQRWTEIRTAADADQLRDDIEGIHDGWYPEGPVDWEDFIDRLDGLKLADGSKVDMGNDMFSPAILRVKAIVRELRRQEQ